ncbi:MAG: hypothetical protein IKV30_01655 [Clostridia bacterium]|nr:hypothetical protein [Clostridia bacterium]
MKDFWDFSNWGFFNLIALLMFSLLVANMLKRRIKFLGESLVPTSVLGGALILIVTSAYKLITGDVLFETAFFGGKGIENLEILTYHALALGFVASTFKASKGKLSRQRTNEIFNTGVTTVATYLLQGTIGMIITIVAALFISGFFKGAGILLPFGYGQGTGQALNYGNIFETKFGFVGGSSFGLTIAALGFLSASIGGVIHLNILRKRGVVAEKKAQQAKDISLDQIQGSNEIPMQGSMDKMTVQIAIVISTYFLAYLIMFVLGTLIPKFASVIYGFNFLLGVLAATLVKQVLKWLNKRQVIHREYTNDFLMTRIGNFFYDIMVVAGVAAIRVEVLKQYWVIMLILGVVGLVITYAYNRVVAKTLFKEYQEEQFMAMYGMLTGTASTGVILLREIDSEFKTPAADNMVYQNFPAIVFGFPLMLLATLAPQRPILTTIILFAFFLVLNVILFRSKIFRRKEK